MEKATDTKELLAIGAKLELCGEKDSAAEVYTTCIREAAALSDGFDALEFLYGRKVYNEPIKTYAKAAEYAFMAACAKRLVELMRGKFPDAGCFEMPSGANRSDAAVLAFFQWLTKSKTPQTADYKILKKAKDSFEKKDKIVIETSDIVSRRRLENVIFGLVNGETRVVGKKLQ